MVVLIVLKKFRKQDEIKLIMHKTVTLVNKVLPYTWSSMRVGKLNWKKLLAKIDAKTDFRTFKLVSNRNETDICLFI